VCNLNIFPVNFVRRPVILATLRHGLPDDLETAHLRAAHTCLHLWLITEVVVRGGNQERGCGCIVLWNLLLAMIKRWQAEWKSCWVLVIWGHYQRHRLGMREDTELVKGRLYKVRICINFEIWHELLIGLIISFTLLSWGWSIFKAWWRPLHDLDWYLIHSPRRRSGLPRWGLLLVIIVVSGIYSLTFHNAS